MTCAAEIKWPDSGFLPVLFSADGHRIVVYESVPKPTKAAAEEYGRQLNEIRACPKNPVWDGDVVDFSDPPYLYDGIYTTNSGGKIFPVGIISFPGDIQRH